MKVFTNVGYTGLGNYKLQGYQPSTFPEGKIQTSENLDKKKSPSIEQIILLQSNFFLGYHIEV